MSSGQVKEIWTPKRMTASGPLVEGGRHIGGFLCTSSTSGTVQITDGTTSGGSDIISSFSVTAGQWYPMPFYMQRGCYAVLTNCAGTFAV